MLRGRKVVVDVSGPAGAARVGKGSGGGWVWTCAYGTLDNDGESMPPFTLHGVDGAKPGDSGTVTYTASADNTASVTGTTGMTAQSGLVLTVRGTGAPLTPTRTPEGGIHDGTGTVTVVETTVQADYTAATGTVRGRVGDTVGVTLGVRGPGPGRPAEERGRFEVVPPEGTTATSIPYTFEDTDGKWACARPKKPGGAFVCDLYSDVLWPGDDGTTSVVFRFRIDRQVPGAHGTVRTYTPYDRTPGNDTARIPPEGRGGSHRAMSQEAGPPRLRGCSHRRPQRSTAWTRD
ncbi:hypothetical protein ACFYRG_46405 [Streptomyces mirabilis]|uniref:hypothetical protein n=1 Tax=Streptomyces mirabilis TaxID=68239 RepID=UPI0036CC720F